METRSTVLTVAAVVATGILAYAVYFDYKRRNDTDFRRKLKKEKKRANKSLAQAQETNATAQAVTPAMLREALEAIKHEPQVPVEQRETYFMTQVGMGEQFASQGPTYHLPAAIAFYRALRIYPSPTELIGIYEKTVPEAVFKLVIEMTNMAVTDHIKGFYDMFPPKNMNASIVKEESQSMQGSRNLLVAARDFAAGETIYKEHPVVAALDQDLQVAGTHCTHCFRTIEAGLSITDDEVSSVFPSPYCSKVCLVASKAQSHGILFTMENPLPEELLVGPMPDLGLGDRKVAQTKFVEYIKEQGRNYPLLVARFIARQIVAETSRLVSTASSGKKGNTDIANDYPRAEEAEYQLADYIERWRFVEVTPAAEELPLLSDLLKATLPGLEQFTTPERYALLVGKMAYNAFGVCFNGGRDDKPAPTTRPEEVEKTRTPYGTQRQVGSAIYNVSTYLTHSCDPSARVSFSSGTNELHLIANKDLKKGDPLTVAFVDVTQHEGESVAECKRRRRVELVRGWRFACGCDRCVEEAKTIAEETPAADSEGPSAASPGPVEPVGDQSKVEGSVANLEANPPAPVPLSHQFLDVE